MGVVYLTSWPQTATRKEMAIKILNSILKNGTNVGSVDKVKLLFDFISRSSRTRWTRMRTRRSGRSHGSWYGGA